MHSVKPHLGTRTDIIQYGKSDIFLEDKERGDNHDCLYSYIYLLI